VVSSGEKLQHLTPLFPSFNTTRCFTSPSPMDQSTAVPSLRECQREQLLRVLGGEG